MIMTSFSTQPDDDACDQIAYHALPLVKFIKTWDSRDHLQLCCFLMMRQAAKIAAYQHAFQLSITTTW